jgi:hypothetical protein
MQQIPSPPQQSGLSDVAEAVPSRPEIAAIKRKYFILLLVES